MIFIVTPYRVFPVRKGGQKFIALFMRYFARHSQLVRITVRDEAESDWAGVRRIPMFSSTVLRYINPIYVFRMASLIRKNKATHIIFEHPYMGWMGLLLKWFTPVKLVIQSHNIEATRWKSLGKWWWPILSVYEGVVHRWADMNFFVQAADRDFAIQRYRVKPEKTAVVTYGIENSGAPTAEEKSAAARQLRKTYNIPESAKILLFTGSFGYKPNLDAVKTILENIEPALRTSGTEYRILICGGGLPEDRQKQVRENPNVIYAGFVDDIDRVFKGADLFLNPVVDGGGIKTKLVEALGWNTPAVSTASGSIGVDPEDAGALLKIVEDENWNGFVGKIVETMGACPNAIPPRYYQRFYWGNITAEAAAVLEKYA